MLTRSDIARDATGDAADTPHGFLPAVAVGELPGSAEYRAELDIILAQVAGDLDAYGISSVVTLTPGQRAGALALAKFYAAEAVIMRSQTGSIKDPEGASTSLSANDLAHWERIRDRGQRDAERYLGPLVKAPPGSGVFFARTNLGGASSRSRYELKEDW